MNTEATDGPTGLDLECLQHMLGINAAYPRKQWGYRNHFAAEPTSTDAAAMERLLAGGFVTKGGAASGLTFYHATLKGCRAAGMTEREIARMER